MLSLVDRNRQCCLRPANLREKILTDVYGTELQPPTPRFHVTHYFESFIVEGPNYFSRRGGWSMLIPIYFRRSGDLREELYELSSSFMINLYSTPWATYLSFRYLTKDIIRGNFFLFVSKPEPERLFIQLDKE